MITVREATGRDVPAVRQIFLATYGTDYTDPRYYDESLLTRLVYSESSLMLVAEDTATGRVVGTASVDLEVGAYSDLVGEFGRLAVHPDVRQHGIGRLLMEERLRRVQDRIQVGIVEARIAQPYSLKIAESHQFAVVGFLPLVWQMRQRESLALLVRYFDNALGLRKNHPRVIPEIGPLAHLALEHCSVIPDVIVDERAPAYPPGGKFEAQDLTTEGYAALLRIERGRVHNREIFGPVRLHYGFFKLQARRSHYLIAREEGSVAGAIGFTDDPISKNIRIFELIALHDEVVRFLLAELERSCREEWSVSCIDVEVSAYAPRMQRTLVELGFLPVAYLPALVFHEVERLDVVRMIRLMVRPEVPTEGLTPTAKTVAELVLRRFRSRSVLPRIAETVRDLSLFAGLDQEQIHRLAGACTLKTFQAGDVIFRAADPGGEMYLVLRGEVGIVAPGSASPVGVVRQGECLGEISLLTGAAHSSTATALVDVEMAVLDHRDLGEFIRLRPDIGLHIYRNLAAGLGEKLRRSGVMPPSQQQSSASGPRVSRL
jgi:CRP-like cAMP-binding protein/GNAT superfamily N-acetyltransferase